MLDESRTNSDRETDALMSLLSEGSSAILNSVREGNIFAWLLAPHAVALKLVEFQRKIDGFNLCVPKAINRCTAAYQRWETEMRSFESEFGPSVAQCGGLAGKLTQIDRELSQALVYQDQLKTTIAKLQSEVDQLRSGEEAIKF